LCFKCLAILVFESNGEPAMNKCIGYILFSNNDFSFLCFGEFEFQTMCFLLFSRNMNFSVAIMASRNCFFCSGKRF